MPDDTGQMQVTRDDGWRRIEGDKAAPKTGSCWLADEHKRMSWESRDGVTYQPMPDAAPYWWRLTPAS